MPPGFFNSQPSCAGREGEVGNVPLDGSIHSVHRGVYDHGREAPAEKTGGAGQPGPQRPRFHAGGQERIDEVFADELIELPIVGQLNHGDESLAVDLHGEEEIVSSKSIGPWPGASLPGPAHSGKAVIGGRSLVLNETDTSVGSPFGLILSGF